MSHQRTCASLAILAAATALLASCPPAQGSEAAPGDGGVRLAKFPHPYQAAVTVASDIDAASVEKFEAVHTLVNTEAVIRPGSPMWAILFADPQIGSRPLWKNGVTGYGLPIADSFYLYGEEFGVFARYDAQRHAPVPHTYQGRDFRDLYDDWFRKGWMDTLHTPGQDDMRREAALAGLEWLRAKPGRAVKVWSNHQITRTPVSLGWKTDPALPLVLRNTAKLIPSALWHLGAKSFVSRFVHNPHPSPFPWGQAAICWTLAAALVLATVWTALCLVWSRLRRWQTLVAGAAVAAVAAATLQLLPLHYAQGDYPPSPHYVADLLRGQFRYYWLASDAPGCDRSYVTGSLVLPEQDYGGRESILSVATLQDGSSVLTFRACYQGALGYRSLELLTPEGLEDLCRRRGTAILHTHWTLDPPKVFTARGLEGLACLRRFRDEGRVWVAPACEILHFTYVRTFLDYEVRSADGKRVIDIRGVKDPIGNAPALVPEDLRGLTFECPDDLPVEVLLAGKPVQEPRAETLRSGGRTRVRFPLAPRRPD